MPSRVTRSPLRQRIIEKSEAGKAEIVAELEAMGEELVAKHKDVVKHWGDKPNFTSVVTVSREFVAVEVKAIGRAARKWRWVNAGTRGPYIIRPKTRRGRLKFQTGYVPKTRPIARVDRAGGYFFGDWRSARRVIHPGIRARKFTEQFERDIRPDFRRRIQNAFRRGVRKL